MSGIEALRNVLLRMRNDKQHGYMSYNGNGEWSFVSTGLPQTSPEELNALFELAGIEPDVIKTIGDCEDCAFSVNGRDGGYAAHCCDCLHPMMSNFVARETGATT